MNLLLKKSKYKVRVTLGTVDVFCTLRFKIDTGATNTLLGASALSDLPKFEHTGYTTKAIGIGNHAITVEHIIVPTSVLCGVEIGPVVIGLSTCDDEHLLGMDILRGVNLSQNADSGVMTITVPEDFGVNQAVLLYLKTNGLYNRRHDILPLLPTGLDKESIPTAVNFAIQCLRNKGR